jgi:hypothetical protein
MASKDPETLRAATAPEKQPLLARSDEPNHEKQHPSIWLDAKDTIVLAAPIFLSILSWVGMKTTDSALLGHVSSDALAAAALSDLVRYRRHPCILPRNQLTHGLSRIFRSGPCALSYW